MCIGADALLGRQRGVAPALPGARRGDTAGDRGARLGRRRQGEIGRGDRRYVDIEVDAVEQRATEAGLVILRAARRPAAGPSRLREIAAAAWVHRGDEL